MILQVRYIAEYVVLYDFTMFNKNAPNKKFIDSSFLHVTRLLFLFKKVRCVFITATVFSILFLIFPMNQIYGPILFPDVWPVFSTFYNVDTYSICVFGIWFFFWQKILPRFLCRWSLVSRCPRILAHDFIVEWSVILRCVD